MSQLRHTTHTPHPQERMMPPCTSHPGGTMQRRTITISAIALAVAGLVTGLVVWLMQPSYDEIAEDCVAALKERAEGDTEKPAACDGLSEDDYDALVLSHVLDGLGWTDDEGQFDKNKMLEDTLNGTP